MKNIFILAIVAVLSACVSGPERVRQADRDKVKSELDSEVSLKADREKFAELRAEIPQDKKDTNDELALYLQIFGQGNERPEVVRNKFTTIVQKRRARFRDKVAKIRENYRKEETKGREEFLQRQKSKRYSFLRTKHDSKDTREFFAEQDKERQANSADERDRRKNFEAELGAESKDFDSYMRERTNEFNEQFRLYSKKFYDKPKSANAVTGDDFNEMNRVQSTPLGTEE